MLSGYSLFTLSQEETTRHTQLLLKGLGRDMDQVLTELLNLNQLSQSFVPNFLSNLDLNLYTQEYCSLVNSVWPHLNDWQKHTVLNELVNKPSFYDTLLSHLSDVIKGQFANHYVDSCLTYNPSENNIAVITACWKHLPWYLHKRIVIKWLNNPEYILPIILDINRADPHDQSGILRFFIKMSLSANNQNYVAIISQLLPVLKYPLRSELLSILLFCTPSGMPYITYLQEILVALENNECYEQLSNEVILECALQFNVYFISLFFPANPLLLNGLLETNTLHQEEVDKIIATLSDKFSDDDRLFLSSLMPQFTYTIGSDYLDLHDECGKTSYPGMLFALSQTKERKAKSSTAYSVTCTVINAGSNNDVDAFFDIVKNAEKPLTEKFILSSGSHWLSGIIWIDEQQHASMLIIDSLGANTLDAPEQLPISFYNAFPEGDLYISLECRQYTGNGCAIFSHEDCMKLFTIEKYLDEQHQPGGLLGYIRDNVVGTVDNMESFWDGVKSVRMPLPFLRLMQSTSVYRHIADHAEEAQYLPVNKKGETIYEALERSFVDSASTSINIRVQEKMTTIAKNNLNYLFNHPDLKEITTETIQHEFTIDGFKSRYGY